jgi:hypothetical protein
MDVAVDQDHSGLVTLRSGSIGREKFMRRIGAVAGVGLLLAAVVVGTAGPGYAAPAKPNFVIQAGDAGLTNAQAASLQTRVNTYLARTGGTQVAINKIDLDGKGTLLLALPQCRSA